MIDHLTSYATDYETTLRFYDAVLETLGYARRIELVATWDPDWPTRRLCAYGPEQKPTFWIAETRAPATPRHIAFRARSRADVDAFHRAGLALGAKDNGAPGLRPEYHASYYGAFLIDPDGNNVEAVTHG